MTTSTIFDADDITHLITLGVPQLRREIHSTELHIFEQRIFIGTPWENDWDRWPWRDYADACKLALSIAFTDRPKPVTRIGGEPRADAVEVKAHSDILAIAERYTKLWKSGRTFTGCCPLHLERHASFFVYPDSQTWHCFGACGTGGDVISFIEKAEQTDFKGALAILEGGP